MQSKKVKFKIFLLLSFIFFWPLAPGTWTLSYADSDISSAEKFFLEGRYEKAASESRRLIESRSRKRYEVYYIKGLSEMKLNRFSDARQSFQNIIDKYQSSPRVFDAYLGIGDSYLLEGRTPSALRAYKEIAERFPQDKNIAVVNTRIAECSAKTESPKVKPMDIPRGESGYISVQVGSFKNNRNADRVAKKLSREGFESFVEIPAGSSDRLYRVKVGRLQSNQSAEALVYRLKAKGYKTKICPAQ